MQLGKIKRKMVVVVVVILLLLEAHFCGSARLLFLPAGYMLDINQFYEYTQRN
jgi:hypothetical protein